MPGEAAEAVLEGIFCQCCGEVFEDMLGDMEPPGYPRTCESCGGTEGVDFNLEPLDDEEEE